MGNGNDSDGIGREPKVPEGVIQGIEELAEGKTADAEDLDAALDWGVDTGTERGGDDA